jgi:hypothetical protein
MKKLIVAAIAAASVLTAVSAANAGYTVCNQWGCVYIPTCNAYTCW